LRSMPCPAKRAQPRAAIILPCFARSLPGLLQKLAMPFHRARPPLFCPLSSEAYLPTKEVARQLDIRNKIKLKRQKWEGLIKSDHLIIPKTKARRPDKKAGLGIWPPDGHRDSSRGEAFFCLDVWLLCI
jgi:hypothetical protein